MKTKNIILLFTAMLFMLTCSKPEKPEMLLLRKLILQKIGDKPFDVTVHKTAITFKSKGKGGFNYNGSFRLKDDFLIIAITQVHVESNSLNYFTGIYNKDKGQWNPLFKDELVYRQLDTIIDLNGDKKNEVIIGGFLYADTGKNVYEEQGSIGDMPGVIQQIINKNGDPTLIVIKKEYKIPLVPVGDEPQKTIFSYIETYAWYPTNGIKCIVTNEAIEKAKPLLDSLIKDLDFCRDFNQTRSHGLNRISFKTLYEEEGTIRTDFFDKNQNHKYYYNNRSVEGGYEETIFKEFENNKIRLILSFKQNGGEIGKGVFGYFQDGYFNFFNVTFNDKVVNLLSDGDGYVNVFEIGNNIEISNMDMNDLNTILPDSVQKSIDRFQPGEGVYEFYTKRKTVESQYGPKEVSECYLIDSTLFVSKFLNKK
jgi:hypothetical protein